MKIFIISCIIAVLSMTAFSALWSIITKNQFREPSLLNKIFKIIFNKNPSNKSYKKLAWITHFLLGAFFLFFYEILWSVFGVDRTLVFGLVFGIVSGIIGVLGWILMFRAVDFNSDFNFNHYFIHLIFAHIIFSEVAVLMYQWLA